MASYKGINEWQENYSSAEEGGYKGHRKREEDVHSAKTMLHTESERREENVHPVTQRAKQGEAKKKKEERWSIIVFEHCYWVEQNKRREKKRTEYTWARRKLRVNNFVQVERMNLLRPTFDDLNHVEGEKKEKRERAELSPSRPWR